MALVEQKRNAYGVWWGILKENDCLEDPDVEGPTILLIVLRDTQNFH
jgi:hypothetical protein